MTVSSEGGGDAEDRVDLVVSISDTGQGMTKEQVHNLFEKFTRFNREINRAVEGTGLGMSITQNLVHMMNGDITVESEPGKGSTFTVTLPQSRSGPDVLGREMAENLHRFRTSSKAQMRMAQISREPMPYGSVLIVDDVETNIYVAKGLMAPYELKIDSADSGYAAIEKIKGGKVYDVIFMDHMMPDLDGIETTQRLRELGYDAPIVALTASAVAGQADIFLQNGFDDFISKPVDIRQLNLVLNKLVRDKHPLINMQISGLDILQGLRRYDGDEAAYLLILRSYATSVRSMLGSIESVGEDGLRAYEVKVHGIKGASRDICADQIARDADALEKAAVARDYGYVSRHNPAFLASAWKLVNDLSALLTVIDAGSPKPVRDRPDAELLKKLRAACKLYDMDGVDAAMAEIERVQYESDDGLLDFLRSSFDMMQFGKIVERLSYL
jgi:CheY-like chemotaxis protein